MSHIPFDQIADHVRELDEAFQALDRKVDILWLAAHGAAVLVPDRGDELSGTLGQIYAEYGDKWDEVSSIQTKLTELLKDVQAP